MAAAIRKAGALTRTSLTTTQPAPPAWKISVRASKSARKPAPVSLPKMSWDKPEQK